MSGVELSFAAGPRRNGQHCRQGQIHGREMCRSRARSRAHKIQFRNDMHWSHVPQHYVQNFKRLARPAPNAQRQRKRWNKQRAQ